MSSLNTLPLRHQWPLLYTNWPTIGSQSSFRGERDQAESSTSDPGIVITTNTVSKTLYHSTDWPRRPEKIALNWNPLLTQEQRVTSISVVKHLLRSKRLASAWRRRLPDMRTDIQLRTILCRGTAMDLKMIQWNPLLTFLIITWMHTRKYYRNCTKDVDRRRKIEW